MKNFDAEWLKNRDKLEGLVWQIQRALKDVEDLPDDMDCPETEEAVECVNPYATRLYDLLCDGTALAEEMMIGKEVAWTYENIQDEKGNTRDMYAETGHTRGDF